MSHFTKDLANHKKGVGMLLASAANDLVMRGINHDMDKLENDIILNTYEKYNEQWRNAPFKSKEHYAIKPKMKEAFDIHAQNRHHFYSERSELTYRDLTLFDYIENLADWIAASDRDCKTVEAKKERISMLINKYYLKGDATKIEFVTMLHNTAHLMIENNY